MHFCIPANKMPRGLSSSFYFSIPDAHAHIFFQV